MLKKHILTFSKNGVAIFGFALT